MYVFLSSFDIKYIRLLLKLPHYLYENVNAFCVLHALQVWTVNAVQPAHKKRGIESRFIVRSLVNNGETNWVTLLEFCLWLTVQK